MSIGAFELLPFDALLEAPTSFVLGRQDASVGWRDPLRLAPRYPRTSFHVVDGAGHNLQIEKPAIFAAAFCEWLAACETGSQGGLYGKD